MRGRAAAHHGAATTGVTKCLTHRAWCPRAQLLVMVTPGPGTSCHPSTEPGLCIPVGAGDLSSPPAPFLGQRVLGRPPAQPGFAFSPVSPRAEECGVTTRGALRRGLCGRDAGTSPRGRAIYSLNIWRRKREAGDRAWARMGGRRRVGRKHPAGLLPRSPEGLFCSPLP